MHLRNLRLVMLPLLAIVFTEPGLAKSLTCEIKINQISVLTTTVETQRQQKMTIGQAQNIPIYITERDNNFYSLEGFAPQYELRFYGEGHLRSAQDKLVASLWGREILVEAECSPLSRKH